VRAASAVIADVVVGKRDIECPINGFKVRKHMAERHDAFGYLYPIQSAMCDYFQSIVAERLIPELADTKLSLCIISRDSQSADSIHRELVARLALLQHPPGAEAVPRWGELWERNLSLARVSHHRVKESLFEALIFSSNQFTAKKNDNAGSAYLAVTTAFGRAPFPATRRSR
jgi:hypothetical protein